MKKISTAISIIVALCAAISCSKKPVIPESTDSFVQVKLGFTGEAPNITTTPMANADGLKSKLDADGYNAKVVFNADRNMYRVIVSSFDDRVQAAQARDNFKAKYASNPDFQKSWLLYAK